MKAITSLTTLYKSLSKEQKQYKFKSSLKLFSWVFLVDLLPMGWWLASGRVDYKPLAIAFPIFFALLAIFNFFIDEMPTKNNTNKTNEK